MKRFNQRFLKIRAEIIAVSKRLFGVPDFVYYAVAYGIFEVLKYVRSGITVFFCRTCDNSQLSFFSSRLNFGET